MDAIEMLTDDHNKVRGLFKEFAGGGGVTGLVRRAVGSVSAAERRKVVDQVCKELEVHTRIEEELFYPAVKALDDRELTRQVNEALREHDKVKQEVAGLRGTTGDEDDLEDRMTRLENDVEHHATEEENEMFPRLEELMPAAERQDLGRRMQALKRRGPKSASSGPRTAPKQHRPVSKAGSSHTKKRGAQARSGRSG
jgi:hemerythrin superfamily protein